jgi:crotonobetainyl-CoA:carnitine CoA-transferase CaiB-like acyl-CoA transferase
MALLEGLRVVDLADEKGELCGRLLADFGADVIRVEPPGGARSRHLPPFAPDGTTSLYFALRNAGKRGLALDLESPAGRERLAGLAAEADLLVESAAPGTLARLGLAPETLLERNPSLVVVSITDFGQVGPYRDFLGTDMIGFAMGAMMHRCGRIERPPLVAPGALAYDTAGVTAAWAAMVAYWKRLRTGRGQHVDVSVMESVANLSDWSLPGYSISGMVGQRAGAGIYTLYRCADGFVRMIILPRHHWHALLEWMGRPEELADPELDVFLNRLVHQKRIEPVVERFFADQKKVDVAREAQRRGIPTTPLLEPSEVLENEHTRARGTFVELEVGGGLKAPLPSGFFHVDGQRLGPRGGPPAPGGVAAAFGASDAARAGLLGEPRSAPPDGHPFRGLRVLDFGVGGVGVEVGRLLAEFGADVIKVETANAPDFIRTIMNSYMNPSFASSSRSKRSFGVDCKSERGRELVQDLVRRADVLIENNATGVMERLGFGPARLRALNPRIVSFSSQMVGSSGPWSDWVGYGPSTHPVSGLQWLWNYPEDADAPAGSTNIYPDHFCGRLGAFGVLAGLVGRERGGRGVHLDAAQFESAIGLLGDLLARESLAPRSVRPQGNASERGAPWGAYRCAGDDEWCAVNVRSDAEWEALRRALGDPDWARDPTYATAPGRAAARAAIDRGLEAWTRQRGPRQAMEELQARGVPAGMLAHPAHHMEDPQLGALGYRTPVEQPGLGRIVLEGVPFRGSDLPRPIITAAPGLGEHTREIARQDLGLSDVEIEALVSRGVLEDPPPEGATPGSAPPRAR